MNPSHAIIALLFAIAAGAPAALGRERVTSAQARDALTVYAGARGALLNSTSDAESGLEAGIFLAPDLLVMAQYQATFSDHLGYCSATANLKRSGVSARLFLANSFFLSAGVARRTETTALRAAAPRTVSDGYDMDGKGGCDTYATAASTRIEAPLSVGWQWQFRSFTIGFEALTVFVPLAGETRTSTYAAQNRTYAHHDPNAGRRAAEKLEQTADWALPTMVLGWAF